LWEFSDVIKLDLPYKRKITASVLSLEQWWVGWILLKKTGLTLGVEQGKQKSPVVMGRGHPCFHNGIILIVIRFKLYLNVNNLFKKTIKKEAIFKNDL